MNGPKNIVISLKKKILFSLFRHALDSFHEIRPWLILCVYFFSSVLPNAFNRIPERYSPPQCVDPVPPDSGGHRWQGHQSITHLQINHRGLRHRNILTFPWWLVLLTSVTRSYMQLKSVVFIGIKFLHSQTVTQINLTICLISLSRRKTQNSR